MRDATLTILLFAFVLIACSESPAIPAHVVVSTQDLSYIAARRYNLRVALPAYYSQEEIEQIARVVVARITASEPVNALSIMFYAPGTETTGAWDVGVIDWAPNGRWADASSVNAGDYRSFRYNVTYRPQ